MIICSSSSDTKYRCQQVVERLQGKQWMNAKQPLWTVILSTAPTHLQPHERCHSWSWVCSFSHGPIEYKNVKRLCVVSLIHLWHSERRGLPFRQIISIIIIIIILINVVVTVVAEWPLAKKSKVGKYNVLRVCLWALSEPNFGFNSPLVSFQHFPPNISNQKSVE